MPKKKKAKKAKAKGPGAGFVGMQAADENSETRFKESDFQPYVQGGPRALALLLAAVGGLSGLSPGGTSAPW